MQKRIAALTATAALTGAAFGAVAFGPTLASGQEAAERAEAAGGWVGTALDELVAEGVIDQTQADAVLEALTDARPERPFGHGPGRPGFGKGLGALETAAETIGIDVSDLAAALRDGQSIADAAAANGVDAQAVIDAIVADIHAQIDEKVADGTLDAAAADERKATVADKISQLVNGELELRRHEGRPFGAPDDPEG